MRWCLNVLFDPGPDANPRVILTSNPDNFSMLSKLLSAPADVAAKAWDLLMTLPTNPVIQSGIASISAPASVTDDGTAAAGVAVPWNTLIDTSSPFRLLYALQIVDTLSDVSAEDGDATVTVVDHVDEAETKDKADKVDKVDTGNAAEESPLKEDGAARGAGARLMAFCECSGDLATLAVSGCGMINGLID